MKEVLRIKWKIVVKLGLTFLILLTVCIYSCKNLGGHMPNDLLFRGPVSPFINKGTLQQSERKLDVNINRTNTVKAFEPPRPIKVHLVVVECGDSVKEMMILLKSAIMFTSSKIMIHIFAAEHHFQYFDVQLTYWPIPIRKKYEYRFHNLSLPVKQTDQWSLLKPCASQRLFLPKLLPDVDALVYVDTDILFLQSLDDLWSYFDKFNSSQLIALSQESEDPAIGWYSRFATHPFYGKFGVNSGVMLMNLTRLRRSDWMKSMQDFYEEYKQHIERGVQDLINIYFHYNPEQLYICGCQWNFRPDHCRYASVCKEAEKDGASIVHGSRKIWLTENEPTFRTIFIAVDEYDLWEDTLEDLAQKINDDLIEAKHTNCGKVFIKQIEKIINATVIKSYFDVMKNHLDYI